MIKPYTHAWNLDSMLIKPVQRITKYPLLFEDLLTLTTPVHADYFQIRIAAETSRALAIEIDETNRRKDVVAGVVSKKSISSLNRTPKSKDSKRGLKMFRKDKSAPMHQSSSSIDLGTPGEITRGSMELYDELDRRVEETDRLVRKIGKEIVHWTAAVKETWTVQANFVDGWLRVVQLDGDDGNQRIEAFRSLIGVVVVEVWGRLVSVFDFLKHINRSWQNDEIRDSVVTTLAKLLESGTNPHKVMARRAARRSDYDRCLLLASSSRRPTDRALLSAAHDFVALHTQLVQELPTFLEGYTRIFDLAITALARAQSRYLEGVQEKLEAYRVKWIPQSGEGGSSWIIQAWQQAWTPYSEAMDQYQCTRPVRIANTRLASFNSRPGSRPSSPSSPRLAHQDSFVSKDRSASPIPPLPPSPRQRSQSLKGKMSKSVLSPTSSTSRFQILRRNSRPNVKQQSLNDPSPAALRMARPIVEQRYSFGLPRIAPEPTFDGLVPDKSHQRAATDPQQYDRSPDPSHPHPFDLLTVRNGGGLGLGDDVRFTSLPTRVRSRRSDRDRPRSISTASDASFDAAEGWRNERVIYRCACVADFDPVPLGDKRYRGLKFLPMAPGDTFE